MPASKARKLARIARFKGYVFTSDAHQRIVDGVRYDILPLPSANCVDGSTLLGTVYDPHEHKPHTLRRRGVSRLTSDADCDVPNCPNHAWHFSSMGNFCHTHVSYETLDQAPSI